MGRMARRRRHLGVRILAAVRYVVASPLGFPSSRRLALISYHIVIQSYGVFEAASEEA